MSSVFPTAIDALSNPTATSPRTNPSHAGQHSDANDAIEALEAKVGVDGSAVTTSLDYLVKTKLPQGAAATAWYAEVTTSQTGIGSSTTDLTGLSVTVTVAAGRRLKITGHGRVLCDATAGLAVGTIQEGATVFNRWFDSSIGAGESRQQEGSAIVSPSAGTHTYKLTLSKAVGAGTVDLNTAATRSAWILVQDIGPA